MIATKAQLEGLKQTYTEENIRVKSVQAHVNEVERHIGQTQLRPRRKGSRPEPILTHQ